MGAKIDSLMCIFEPHLPAIKTFSIKEPQTMRAGLNLPDFCGASLSTTVESSFHLSSLLATTIIKPHTTLNRDRIQVSP
jgi:hypothetical protein